MFFYNFYLATYYSFSTYIKVSKIQNEISFCEVFVKMNARITEKLSLCLSSSTDHATLIFPSIYEFLIKN